MPRRPSQPSGTPRDLSPEKAHAALSAQLDELQKLKGRNYQEAKPDEQQWEQFTGKLMIRAFGSDSANVSNFSSARSAGKHRIIPYGGSVDHGQNQRNYEARLQAYEATLKSSLSELAIDLPEAELKGVYVPGEEYEFYRDIKQLIQQAQHDVLIVDPYIDTDIFDVYADAVPRTASFRLLTSSVPSNVLAVAKRYAGGGNFQLRSSGQIHDRVVFVDNRVWVVGQSLKDAARKKTTYIVEHDEPLMRIIYEDIWAKATAIL